jgi:hypothetical protein
MFLLNLQRVKITLILIGYESEIKCITSYPPPFWRLCRNQNGTCDQVAKLWTCLCEAASAKAGRKPFIGQLLGCKPMKRLHLHEAPLPIPLNDRILKLRNLTICSVRILPSIMIPTQSLWGREKGENISNIF